MIGVIPKAGQTEIIEEFFELFKTPWEWYVPGRPYDAVIVTASELSDIDAKLLLVFGADSKNIDRRLAITARTRQEESVVDYRDTSLPIYQGLLTFSNTSSGEVWLKSGLEAAAIKNDLQGQNVLRIGFDIFEEARFLLSVGQPAKNAHVPTLDMHIEMLRQWILEAGIGFIEIPPTPAGYRFCVSLTHDIDFVGIRNHKFDHTMWGFLYRATVGSFFNLLRGRLSLAQVLKCWRAALSLPGVFLGWFKDFWEPFGWYLRVEKNLPATYFLIPFPGRPGDHVSVPHPSRRAARYDIADLSQEVKVLVDHGCEIGVHGIDSWHSEDRGKKELERIAAVCGKVPSGIRMHWLLRDETTFRTLENAGYIYDSTAGYNDTIGYRSGTTQCFRPLKTTKLLELPLHIQDGALFYPQNLDLAQSEAWKLCRTLTDHANAFGGVLTVLWHDRSHAPERFWGSFYEKLIEALKSAEAWFGSASEVVTWFRNRRDIDFERCDERNAASVRVRYSGEEIAPPVKIRIHLPPEPATVSSQSEIVRRFHDFSWNGCSIDEVNEFIRVSFESAGEHSRISQNGLLAGSVQ